MKIHEYQAKALLGQYGVAVLDGVCATHPAAAYDAARNMGGGRVVVKAQIHAGGRGKAGGVKVVDGPIEAAEAAAEIIGKKFVTAQTGAEGKVCRKVLVEKAAPIAQELYFSILMDRSRRCPVILASAEGGVEIEQLAVEKPEAIIRVPVHPLAGFSAYVARQLSFGLNLKGSVAKSFMKFAAAAYKAYDELNCSLLEINPLVVTEDERVVALDAKITFDDNILPFRKDLAAYRDYDEEEELEILADRYGVDYVRMDGGIGCLVNGAGLAMATMDIILKCGSRPANFLDIKGGASVENVIRAFTLLMRDSNVKAVLINIFGGIVKCDMVAQGILEAMKHVKVDVPVVARLSGTNAEAARKILDEAEFPFITADNLLEAAQKAVKAEKGEIQ